jgi:hypothetical protein
MNSNNITRGGAIAASSIVVSGSITVSGNSTFNGGFNVNNNAIANVGSVTRNSNQPLVLKNTAAGGVELGSTTSQTNILGSSAYFNTGVIMNDNTITECGDITASKASVFTIKNTGTPGITIGSTNGPTNLVGSSISVSEPLSASYTSFLTPDVSKIGYYKELTPTTVSGTFSTYTKMTDIIIPNAGVYWLNVTVTCSLSSSAFAATVVLVNSSNSITYDTNEKTYISTNPNIRLSLKSVVPALTSNTVFSLYGITSSFAGNITTSFSAATAYIVRIA